MQYIAKTKIPKNKFSCKIQRYPIRKIKSTGNVKKKRLTKIIPRGNLSPKVAKTMTKT